MRNKNVTKIPDFIKDLIFNAYRDSLKEDDPPFERNYIWFLRPDRRKAFLFTPSETTKKNIVELTKEDKYFSDSGFNFDQQSRDYEQLLADFDKEFHEYNGRREIRLRLNATKGIGVYYELPDFEKRRENPWYDKYLGLMEKPRCVRCHAEFVQKRPWQIYCSKECKKMVFQEIRGLRKITGMIKGGDLLKKLASPHTCINCGTVLPDTIRSHAKFCCGNCRVVYHRKKKVSG